MAWINVCFYPLDDASEDEHSKPFLTLGVGSSGWHYLDRESGTALTQEDLEATLGFNIVAGRQTRASTAHSSFMRPVCKTIKVGM
jgi:hypothetical protein